MAVLVIADLILAFAAGLPLLILGVLLWDRSGAEATFLAGAGAAAVAMMMLSLLPVHSRRTA
jgi:hypothetical protein